MASAASSSVEAHTESMTAKSEVSTGLQAEDFIPWSSLDLNMEGNMIGRGSQGYIYTGIWNGSLSYCRHCFA
jgi:hypothetical protein